MPRLRIKSPNGTIQRVQVADDCTLQQLKESVAQQVSLQSVASEVRLSLNKKVEIDGQATDSLRSLGICSGDTLWLMSGPSEAQQSSITEAHPSQSTAQPAAPSTADAADPIPASTSLHEPSSTTADVAEPSAAEVTEAVDGAAAVSGVSAPDYLQRVIDSCQTDITHAHQLMILAMHAVLLETGLQLVQQPDGQHALPTTVSNTSARLEYRLQCQPDSPSCEVKYISLGGAFACIAANSGVSTDTLNVSLKQHVDQSKLSAGNASQHAATAAFKHLPQLWTELKDGLALKLVAALRQRAGLAPLFGLLALPSDLKHKILLQLQAKDLAALGCCCTELRHTASSDLLWQPLFNRELGYVTHYENIQGGASGWQRLFARRYIEREEMRAVRRRMHSRHVGPPRMPYGSPRIPPGPPGLITGGDYDRLPQPFLGGIPGMFGGALGSHRFGGQGPPPSAFLGGSRSGRGARAADFRLH